MYARSSAVNSALASPWRTRDTAIAVLAALSIAVYLVLQYGIAAPPAAALAPLVVTLLAGGLPLVVALGRQLFAGQFGSDLIAGVAIVASVALGEYLVAAVVVLMLSGGQALETYATRRASSVLDALARRSPTLAHRHAGDTIVDVPLGEVQIGDVLVVLPHELCPVDGIVQSGVSTMDESYLSGEPFLLSKTTGAPVISGAINGDGALTIVAERRAVDSRYERIMQIVRTAEEKRPPMRRLADRLGAWYTPLALGIAVAGWAATGDPSRFLAVLVIATPCPLLLGIPIAIIGAVSLAAKRGIVIKDAALLERIGLCRTAIFDKTGTLTLGRPVVTEVVPLGALEGRDVLAHAASLEQYSRHPLAAAMLRAADAEGAERLPVSEVSERPGQGLTGRVAGRAVRVTGRTKLGPGAAAALPPETGGLECVILVDEALAGLVRFRDVPRQESRSFVGHLGPQHDVSRLLLVSGDRESEVRYLAATVGITDVYFNQSPEQKVVIVRRETERRPTLFVGDGLNDAPAMLAATAGVALGHGNEVTAESAGAVILDGSLSRVDELMHIARHTRRIALQTAVGGMAASMAGMLLAVGGWLPPLTGAVAQEAIDVAAVLNALRAAFPPRDLTDF